MNKRGFCRMKGSIGQIGSLRHRKHRNIVVALRQGQSDRAQAMAAQIRRLKHSNLLNQGHSKHILTPTQQSPLHPAQFTIDPPAPAAPPKINQQKYEEKSQECGW
jgi:hypothetical protein